MKGYDAEYEISETQYPGHASELAKNAKNKDYSAIVAVGGDGTLNEVASELVYSDIPLGIIPGGSGNGLSTHLGIGRNMKRAIEVLKAFNVKTMDTAKVNDTFYINMAGLGLDALVAYKTKQSAKRGFSTYFKGAMMESLRYKNQTYKVEVDGKEYVGKFLSINVANGSMFGYNFTVAPNADTSDGLINSILIHDAHKINYFGNAWRFFTKSIHRSRLASINKSNTITVTCYEDSYMHIDGEGYLCPAGEIKFEVLPDSIKVIC